MTLPQDYFLTKDDPGVTILAGTPIMGQGAFYSTYGIGLLDAAINVAGVNSDILSCALSAPLASGWATFLYRKNGGTTLANYDFFRLQGATSDLLRFRCINTTGSWKIEYYNGSGWTQIGADITSPDLDSDTFKLDVYWNIADSGGEFSVYINGSGTPLRSVTGIDSHTTADTAVTKMLIGGCSNSSSSKYEYFGAIMADTADTRNLFVCENSTLATGAFDEWDSGNEAYIDDPIWNSTPMNDMNYTSGVGDRVTYTFTSLTSFLSGATALEGVVIYAHGQGAGNPSLFCTGLAYISSTAYESADGGKQFNNVNSHHHRWEFENDPSTAAPWASVTAINDAQMGLITGTEV